MGEKSDRSAAYRIFFIVGLAFVVIGISNQTTFLAVGIAFFVIGLVGMANERSLKSAAEARDREPPLEELDPSSAAPPSEAESTPGETG